MLRTRVAHNFRRRSHEYMKIRRREVETVTVLHLHGKLTGETDLAALHDLLEELADRGRANVVLNLENVPWVDSGGVGSIMRAYFAFVRRGGRLKLCAPTPRVDEALLTIALHNVFDIYTTESEAIAALLTRLSDPGHID